MQALRWVLIWRSQGETNQIGCRWVVQLDGSVLIWHMMDWFSTACCLYGDVQKVNGPSAALLSLLAAHCRAHYPQRQPTRSDAVGRVAPKGACLIAHM
jgi:hypothetical protein